ncbi:MAG: DUF1559 domain-containing protein, partial [Bythopirellula sp.]
NNLKQLGLSALNFESARKVLPPGHRMTKVGTNIDSLGSWVTQLMPYLEEANLFDKIDQKELFFEQTVDNGAGEYEKTHHIFLDSMVCPSDPFNISEIGLINGHYGARGNYVANGGWADSGDGGNFEKCGIWMNDPDWRMISPNGSGFNECALNGVRHSSASGGFGGIAFAALAGYGPFMVNRGIDLKEATDGTSNTVAFAELLTVPGRDMRGCLHWGGGAMYLHGEPPNSSTADLARFCGDEEVPQAPCRDSTQGWTGAHKLAARSAHPGGVNVVMIDGSVHFVPDDVDTIDSGGTVPGVWQALSTYQGEELVNSSDVF